MTYAGLMYESWQQLQPKCKPERSTVFETTYSRPRRKIESSLRQCTHLFLFFFQVEHSILLSQPLFRVFEHSIDTSFSFLLFHLFLSIKKEVSYLYSLISIYLSIRERGCYCRSPVDKANKILSPQLRREDRLVRDYKITEKEAALTLIHQVV